MSAADFEALVDAAGTEEDVVALTEPEAGWFNGGQAFTFVSWYRNWFEQLTPEEGFTHLDLLKLTVKNIYNLAIHYNLEEGEEAVVADGSITWVEWNSMTVQQQSLYVSGGGDPPVLEAWEALPAVEWDFDSMTWAVWVGLGDEQRAYWVWLGGGAPLPPHPADPYIPWLTQEYWDSRTDEEKIALIDAGFRPPPEPHMSFSAPTVNITEEFWETLTEDQQADLLEYGKINMTQEFWDSLSEDEKQTYMDSGGTPPLGDPDPPEEPASYTPAEWAALTDEEKAEALEGNLAVTEELWNSLTDEEKADFAEAGIFLVEDPPPPNPTIYITPEEWDAMSDEEKEEAMENNSISINQEFWDNLTEEEKEAFLEAGYTEPLGDPPPPEPPEPPVEEESGTGGFAVPELAPGLGTGLSDPGPQYNFDIYETPEVHEDAEKVSEITYITDPVYEGADTGPYADIGDQNFGTLEAPKVPHQPANLFGQLSSDADRSVTWETQPGEPVHGEKRRLSKYSPFLIWVEPPSDEYLYIDPADAQGKKKISGPKAVSSWGGTASDLHTSAEGYSSSLRTSIMNQALRPYNPALFTCHQLADMYEQYMTMNRTPALIMLINPNDMSVTYNKVQNFTERTRQGYIYKAWGHEPTTISFSGQIGAFYAGESNTSDVRYSGEFISETDSPTGNQEASRKYSAAYQNLMNLQSIYFNNGYIRDRANSSEMRPSLAHHQIGTVNIWFDGVHYRGHFDKLEYSFEEEKNRGGLAYSFDFTAMEIIDMAESPVSLKRLTEPNFGDGLAGDAGDLMNVGDADNDAPEDWKSGVRTSMDAESFGDFVVGSLPWDTEGWDEMSNNERWLALSGGSPDSGNYQTMTTPGNRGFEAGEEGSSYYYEEPEDVLVLEDDGSGDDGVVPGGSGSDYDNDPEPGPDTGGDGPEPEDGPEEEEPPTEEPPQDPESPSDPGQDEDSGNDGSGDGTSGRFG